MSNITSTDFYKKTPYNPETLNQIWMSEIADSHDIWCNCTGPFAHLLASIFPPGHQDRNRTVEEIIQRDYKQCLSIGEEEKGFTGHGKPSGKGDGNPEGGGIGKEELEELFAAGENPEEGTR